MFDIWTIPIGIVVAVIVLIGILSIWKKPHYNPDGVLNRQDRSVAEPIEDHPFTMNPILWVILVAAVFTLLVIFYYWASFA